MKNQMMQIQEVKEEDKKSGIFGSRDTKILILWAVLILVFADWAKINFMMFPLNLVPFFLSIAGFWASWRRIRGSVKTA